MTILWYFSYCTFESIKADSGTVSDMINAVYQDNPLIFIGTTFLEKLVSHHWAVNEADSCLLMRRVGSKSRHWQWKRNRTSLDVCGGNVWTFQRPQIIGQLETDPEALRVDSRTLAVGSNTRSVRYWKHPPVRVVIYVNTLLPWLFTMRINVIIRVNVATDFVILILLKLWQNGFHFMRSYSSA